MASTLPEKSDDNALEERAAFLSAPPRSGEFSPYAQKLGTQAFVWLCSIVVFGSAANFNFEVEGKCLGLCRFSIAAGAVSFSCLTLLLIGHILVGTRKLDRSSWLSSDTEKRFMTILAFWWAIASATASAISNKEPYRPTLPFVFSWLAFFGSMVASYKAYHASKEEMKSLSYTRQLNLEAAEEEEYANF